MTEEIFVVAGSPNNILPEIPTPTRNPFAGVYPMIGRNVFTSLFFSIE
jgi:hypothetical protein